MDGIGMSEYGRVEQLGLGVDEDRSFGGSVPPLETASQPAERPSPAAAEPSLVCIRNPPPPSRDISELGASVPDRARQTVEDVETGELLCVERRGTEYRIVEDLSLVRVRRYLRLATARRLLPTKHRVRCCHHVLARDAVEVEIWRSLEHGRAHFKNLMVCGSVWLCAVCAAKISERRRHEVLHAMSEWRLNGGSVWLLTYTFSHGRHDDLKETLASLANARKLMRKGRAFDELRARYGWIGGIQAFEITHGEANGWHPHIHELIFVSGGGDRALLKAELYRRWRSACLRSGLGEPSLKRGLDVRDGMEAGRYAAKWGLDQELVKGHIKAGRGSSRSPMQLLDDVVSEDLDESSRDRAASLWRDYARSIKGRRQLFWSPGLKDRFGVSDVSDEEHASSLDESAELLGSISVEDWVLVCRYGLHADVLDLADRANLAGISALLAHYRGIDDRRRGG